MIARIPQRTQDDCTICAVAMIMGAAFPYERVLADSSKYPSISEGRKFLAWWESYLSDNGFRKAYRPFLDLYSLPRFQGKVAGLLGMDFPHERKSHVVVVDEVGVIDSANGSPSHCDLQTYILSRIEDGAVFHKEFLGAC